MYGHNPRDLKYRFQRVSPIEVSPHDPGVVYHGSQYLHRTTDEGVTWETISPDLTAFRPSTQVISGTPITRDITGEEFYSTLYAVEESPLTPGVIWVGSNDGPVHITRDGGKTWTGITPDELPPGGRVQTIEPSPHREGKAYIAVYRYLLGDWRPYIYRTDDYGASWSRLTTGANGIPADYPTRVVREDPDREGLLYAGTEFGMFISFDDGAHWQSFQLNLPVTPITDIKLHRKDLVLSTMGRSFWILYDVTPLHRLEPAIASAAAHLFQPRAAYRMRYSTRGAAPHAPQYPPVGATIDYFLAQPTDAPIQLEILDSGGQLVREFSGARSERAAEGTAGPGFRFGNARPTALTNSAGMHRFVWDLTHPGPWDPESGRAGRNGPMAVPGTYRARLSVGDWSETRAFDVVLDPRVSEDGVTQDDLEEQLAFNIGVRDAISDARRAARHIEQLRAQLHDRSAKIDDPDLLAELEQADDRLAGLAASLVTEEGRYPQPMLVDQLEYLYNMTSDADQKVGADAHDRFAELERELTDHRRALHQLLESNLTSLNRRLREGGIEPLDMSEP
jgi:hypothetical protein